MAQKKSFFEKLSYVFAPKEEKGTSWFERAITTFLLRGEEIWTARPEMPEEKRLIDAMGELSEKMHVTPPKKILIYKSDYPNAARLAGGTVVVGTDLMRILEKPQLDAVIGHELSHQKHTETDSGAVIDLKMLALVAMHNAVWPLVASKIKPDSKIWKQPALAAATIILADLYAMHYAALPYRRMMESRADKEGANVTSPEDMIGALEALRERGKEIVAEERKAKGLPEEKNWIEKSYDSWRHFNDPHPSIKTRVADLRKMQSESKERVEVFKKQHSYVDAIAKPDEPVHTLAP